MWPECLELTDVEWMRPTDPERLGYPTQKPTGLLVRIIGSSCPDDGVVLDPFCGCGTTIEAAQNGSGSTLRTLQLPS